MLSLDTRPLRDLIRSHGPFASAYVDFSHDTEDAAAQVELRRRAVRAELLELGAAEDTVDAVDEAIGSHEAAVGRAGLAVIGARGSVLHTELLPEPPPVPLVRHSPLPYLLPLLECSRAGVPHVVAVVDRTGADVRAVNASGATVDIDEVRGREHHLHEVGGGGWAHRSIRSRVEENVRHNLGEVAEVVGRLATKVNAGAVMVAGEVQARTGLLAALPEPARRVAVELTAGSRAAGSDNEALRAEIARVLDRITADDHEELLDSYRGNRGVQGLPAVTAALRDGNAEAVLVNPSLLRDRTVWATAGEPTWLGATRQELLELGLGGDGVTEWPADEAIPVAAVAVGAELLVTAELEPTDGIGAVLRHT
jgi:Bacterial archaeo-eukaryotic release factor family 2